MLWIIGIIVAFLVLSIKIVYHYERGVRFTLGKYTGLMEPGLRFIIPIIHQWQRVDLRLTAIDVPDQDCITKDNVSVRVNAVLYFLVTQSQKAVIEVENYMYAVTQLSQTTMRNVVGEFTMDELLSNRDEVSKRIESIVDKETDPWGIKVESVDLKDVVLPENMKRTMAKEAEAERERRALIISSEGEKEASSNLMEASRILNSEEGAKHLRTLKNFNDVASDPSNTMVFAVPIDSLKALEDKGGAQ